MGYQRLNRLTYSFGISMLAFLVVLISACSSGGDEPVSPSQVKAPSAPTPTPVTSFQGEATVYVVGPMSGLDAEIGQAQAGGARLAAQDTNWTGGVLEQQIVIKVLDDEGTPEGAQRAARTITDSANAGERIIGVIITESSDPDLLAVTNVYSSLNTLVVLPVSTSPVPAVISDAKFFRISASNVGQATQAASLLNSLARSNTAVVYTADAYGQALAARFEQAAQQLGLNVAASVEIDLEGVSYAEAAKQVKQSGAEGVFFAGGETEAIVLLSDLYDQVYRGAFILSDRAFTNNVVDQLGCKAEGIFATSLLPDANVVMNHDQLNNYANLEYREPGLYSVAGYSGLELIAQAYKSANALDANAAAQAAHGLDVNTLIGNISYDSGGNLTVPRVYFFRVGGGSYGQALALPSLELTPSAQSVKSLVMVANFVNDTGTADSGGEAAARTVVQSLEGLFGVNGAVDVRVLNKAVTLEEGSLRARELGEELGADLLLWGTYSGEAASLSISPRFEMFDRPERSRKQGRVGIAQVASFGLQRQTWSQADWVRSFTHGIVQYWRGFYSEALSDFETVRSQALPTLDPNDRRTVLLFLGNSNLYSVLDATSESVTGAVAAPDTGLLNSWTRACGTIVFASELPPEPHSATKLAAAQGGATDLELVTITARCISTPPTEDWRCNNFKYALAEVNAALLAEGTGKQINLKIIQDESDWDTYKQEFVTFSNSGSPPDIILSGHEDVGQWSRDGLIMPLDDLISGQSAAYDNVIDGLWPSVTFQGQRWAVPQDAEARPLFWSKPLLRQLGWSDDQINGLPNRIKSGEFTLQDVLITAKQAVDAGVVQPGFGFWHRPRNGPDFWEYYYDMGGETLDAATGKLVYDRAVGLKHFKFFEDATQNLNVLVNDIFDRGWGEWHSTVSSVQQVVFWAGGTWNWGQWAANSQIQELGGQDFLFENIGFGLIPAAEKGGKPITLTHPLAYMISSQSMHPDLAFRLITAITNDEANTRHAVSSAHLGLLKSQLDYEPYAEDKFLTETLYMLEYTTFLPNHPDWAVYSDTWFEGMQNVESGKMTSEEAVEFVVGLIEERLGEAVIIR